MVLLTSAKRLHSLLGLAVAALAPFLATGQPQDNWEDLVRTGQELLAHHDPRGAARAFQHAVDLNPSSARAHTGLGLALFQLLSTGSVRASLDSDTADRAEDHLKQAASLSPSAPRPLLELAELEAFLAGRSSDEESRSNHYEEARRAVKQAISLEPSKPEMYITLANIERDEFTPILEHAKAPASKIAGPIPDASIRSDLRERYLALVNDAIANAERASEMNASAQRPLLLLSKLFRERALLRDTQEQYETDMNKAANWHQQFLAVGGHTQ